MLSELAFSASDLAQTRFAISPMWEVVTSSRVLSSPHAHPVHQKWAEQVRPRAAAAGLDRGWISELIPPTGYLPDFLNPAPADSFAELSTELEAIRSTPAEQVRTELEHYTDGRKIAMSPRVRSLYADPESVLPKVADEIAAYWELALAPYWARIRVVLEADVFHRARQVAEYGAAYLFNDLHSSLSWDDDTLRLVRDCCAVTREASGPGLVLVPTAFAWSNVLSRVVPPQPPQLAYPARAAGTIWARRPIAHAEAIAGVIGRSRTLLLAELEAPASTTDLATRTGLSASGISQHLSALRGAGMVSAHRAGHSVLYARTAVADSLLAGSA